MSSGLATPTYERERFGPNTIPFSDHPSQARGPGAAIAIGAFGALLAVGVVAFLVLSQCRKRRRLREENRIPKAANAMRV